MKMQSIGIDFLKLFMEERSIRITTMHDRPSNQRDLNQGGSSRYNLINC